MLIVFKGIALFLAIIVLMPVIFFFLVKAFGKFFSVAPRKDSWVEKTKPKNDLI